MPNKTILETIYVDGKRISTVQETCLRSEDVKELGRLQLDYGNYLERYENGERSEWFIKEMNNCKLLMRRYEKFVSDNHPEEED